MCSDACQRGRQVKLIKAGVCRTDLVETMNEMLGGRIRETCARRLIHCGSQY